MLGEHNAVSLKPLCPLRELSLGSCFCRRYVDTALLSSGQSIIASALQAGEHEATHPGRMSDWHRITVLEQMRQVTGSRGGLMRHPRR